MVYAATLAIRNIIPLGWAKNLHCTFIQISIHSLPLLSLILEHNSDRLVQFLVLYKYDFHLCLILQHACMEDLSFA